MTAAKQLFLAKKNSIVSYCAPADNPGSSALDRQALGAFLLYLALSFLLFGRGLIENFSESYIGRGPDSAAFIWFLNWWSYALFHRINPFLTNQIFAPSGANLAWATTVPLAGWLFAPITHVFGPVVTYNLLCLLAPALAGWASFVMCRWVVRSYWPAVAGGWVFGFSAYLIAALQTHVHDALVFPVPLAVWFVMRRVARQISMRRFVVNLALTIAAQFLLFAEISASATLIGALVFVLAISMVDPPLRRALWVLAGEIGLAYVIAAALISPYLYYMFSFGHPADSVFDPTLLGADLLSFLVPTSITEVGTPAFFGAISRTFKATLTEVGSYIAWPLILVLVLFTRTRAREPICRLLVETLAVVCVLALGAHLVIAGHSTVVTPWALLLKLPLANKIVPVRLMMYAFLALAIVTAMWMASGGESPARRWTLGIAIAAFTMPNLSAQYWTASFTIPPFFSTGLYRKYLHPGDTVMVLPNPIYGDGIQWQVATDMYFRLAGGYIGIAPLAPSDYARWPIMTALYGVAGVPDAEEQFKALLAHERVDAVIISPSMYRFVDQVQNVGTSATWLHEPLNKSERDVLRNFLSTLEVRPQEIGGVIFYRVPSDRLTPYLRISALEMQQRYARDRFSALLLASQRYIDAGGIVRKLNERKEQVLSTTPRWFGGSAFPKLNPNKMFQVQWALGEWHPGLIAIGVQGTYQVLQPLIDEYGPYATSTYFPFPSNLTKLTTSELSRSSASNLMVMEFSPAGLKDASAKAELRASVP